MQKNALFIATSLAMSGTLHANDLSYYGGAALSRSSLDAHFDFVPSNEFTGTSDKESSSSLKLFGGLRIPLAGGFYGGEIAYSGGGANPVGTFSKTGNPVFGQRGDLEDQSSISLSLTGGFALGGNNNLIGRIGYIRTDLEYKTLEGSTVYASGDEAFSGVEVALGLEHRLSEQLGIFFEFSRVNFSDNISATANGTGDLADFDDVSRDAFSLGLFSKF